MGEQRKKNCWGLRGELPKMKMNNQAKCFTETKKDEY